MVSPPFLICFWSDPFLCLQVTRTCIKSLPGSSLILGRIRPLILELLALEWRKLQTFELEYLWSQLANLDQILCVASLGVGKGCIMFWGRLDQNSGVHGNRKPPLIYNGENGVSTFSHLLLIRSFFMLAGNEDMHKISPWVKFDFGQNQTTHFRVTCPWVTKIANFWTWVSLKPVGQSWSNFMCSITGGGERLHNVLRQFGSKLWCPWQQKAPIDL